MGLRGSVIIRIIVVRNQARLKFIQRDYIALKPAPPPTLMFKLSK